MSNLSLPSTLIRSAPPNIVSHKSNYQPKDIYEKVQVLYNKIALRYQDRTSLFGMFKKNIDLITNKYEDFLNKVKPHNLFNVNYDEEELNVSRSESELRQITSKNLYLINKLSITSRQLQQIIKILEKDNSRNLLPILKEVQLFSNKFIEDNKLLLTEEKNTLVESEGGSLCRQLKGMHIGLSILSVISAYKYLNITKVIVDLEDKIKREYENEYDKATNV